MCNDTGRIIVGKYLPFILGILNSRIFFYAVKKFYGGGGLGEKGIRMKHTFFGNFPCPPYNKKVEVLAKTISSQHASELYERLDNLINSIYSLTAEEIDVIQNETM